MKYRLLEKDRLALSMPASNPCDWLSGEAVREIAVTLPDIAGLYAGMSFKDFESVMGAAVVEARKAFVKEEGNAFGDRRGPGSVLRGKEQEVSVEGESLKTAILECAKG